MKISSSLVNNPKFCYRSSLSKIFYKIGVVKIFVKLVEKHTCLGLIFIKLGAATLSEKRLRHRSFPVNFAKFLEHLL